MGNRRLGFGAYQRPSDISYYTVSLYGTRTGGCVIMWSRGGPNRPMLTPHRAPCLRFKRPIRRVCASIRYALPVRPATYTASTPTDTLQRPLLSSPTHSLSILPTLITLPRRPAVRRDVRLRPIRRRHQHLQRNIFNFDLPERYSALDASQVSRASFKSCRSNSQQCGGGRSARYPCASAADETLTVSCAFVHPFSSSLRRTVYADPPRSWLA